MKKLEFRLSAVTPLDFLKIVSARGSVCAGIVQALYEQVSESQ